MPDVKIAALYCFARFTDAEAIRAPLFDLCRTKDVKGTILLASEGINGTIAGPPDGVDAVVSHVRNLPGCAKAEIKFAESTKTPFHRLKVRIKKEIVTLGAGDLDPARNAGIRVPASEWNALIADPDTILIDTRNDYEVAAGSFAGAIDPQTAGFTDFPQWFRDNRERLLGGKSAPKVAMFCTGGIRCEKSTALLKAEGVDQVFHLDGGILRYLETVPEAESRWQGECFVFDERVTVGHGLAPGSHVLCRACRRPVNTDGRLSPHYVEGQSCAACYSERSNEDRARYAERHRQVALADARGEAHVGKAQNSVASRRSPA